MISGTTVFSNPDNLPVESLSLFVTDAGIVRQVKALDTYWVPSQELTLYERPPSGSSLIIGAVEAWKTKMNAYLEDVKWILSLEYHRFWSTILYHPHCMDSLVSFLQEASPPYLPPHESRDVQTLYEDIRKHVFVVFSRLVTNKESKTQWMTKEFMGDILYNKFIFTIPIIWDICITYGVDNTRHVSRLLESVFVLQPKYEQDAVAAISFVHEVSVFVLQPKYEQDAVAAISFVHEAFKFIILQVNNNYNNADPPNLPETFKGFSEVRRPSSKKDKADKLTLDVLKDLIIHMLDTAMTLRIFIEVYPKAGRMLRKTNLVISIVQLYECGIPALYEKLSELGDESSVAYAELEAHLHAARAELVDVFREILAVYKNEIFSGEGNIQSHVEDYLAVMMDGLSERLLIKDYHACYPVHDDIEMLREAYPEIDTVKTDFILQAIYSNLDEPIPETIHNGHADHRHTTDHTPVDTHNTAAAPTKESDIPDHIREESLISEVKDIMPHLGDGYVLKCLKHYGFSAERVINSILEGTLAEPLRELDQSMPLIPEDILDNKFLETGIERLNVFDGDRFDIMTRDDVDLSKIHVGKKKEKYRDLKDMLDDKMDVKQLSDIYSKYNLVADEETMYSDEYDDTYDSDGVVPTTADVDERRPFVTPRALMQRGRHEEESEEEEDEEPSPSAGPSSRMDFCANPEEARARREAAFHARRGKGHKPPPPRNTDVVGKARGQGQEKQVLQNRDKKEKTKSTRGNHNRRQGATWKRSQGMVPS